jgi:hypothetical protein
MKFETLIQRYKNLGYKPKDLDNELEIDSLIKWIYDTYDIFISLMFHDKFTINSYNKVSHLKMKSFIAYKVWNCNKEYSNTIYSDKYFENPYDAKFNMVKEVYKAIKFLFH